MHTVFPFRRITHTHSRFFHVNIRKYIRPMSTASIKEIKTPIKLWVTNIRSVRTQNWSVQQITSPIHKKKKWNKNVNSSYNLYVIRNAKWQYKYKATKKKHNYTINTLSTHRRISQPTIITISNVHFLCSLRYRYQNHCNHRLYCNLPANTVKRDHKLPTGVNVRMRRRERH